MSLSHIMKVHILLFMHFRLLRNTVPGALRELVAACRASDVPLWVINDP